MHDSDHDRLTDYVVPEVRDLGDLAALTAGFQGTGGPDAAFPNDPIFPDNSAPFGP